MKRRPLSKHSSRKIFRRGNKINKKNALGGVSMHGIMRGGIRL